MIVICKKPTKRLIKGVRYETGSLYNDVLKSPLKKSVHRYPIAIINYYYLFY